MTSWTDRKRLDLARRLTALDLELGEWRKRAEPGGRYRKHHYQIQRLTDQLLGFNEKLKGDVAAGDPLAIGSSVERMSLELHRIWEFFRSKLSQRSIDWYLDYLLAADELAWQCYKPARDRAVASKHVPLVQVTEPPLVFFNGASSPLSIARDSRFSAEPVLIGKPVSTEELREILMRLPIPVIGIPWFQVQHLPDALLIAHEVGHLLEDDLRLSGRVTQLLDTALHDAPEARRACWSRWRSEVFADVCGTLLAGPAFVDGMIHFLVRPPAEIAAELAGDASIYPTTALRVRLACEVLTLRPGLEQEAERIWKDWTAVFGEGHAMSEFDGDVPHVVAALAGGRYPELTVPGAPADPALHEVLSFGAAEQGAARSDCMDILLGVPPQSGDVRVLFAAASLAHQADPKTYAAQGQAIVLARVRALQDNAVRGPDDPAEGLRQADRARGANLFDWMTTLNP